MNYLYRCTVCNSQFTRKWNANRHNRDSHNGLADTFSIKDNVVLSIRNNIFPLPKNNPTIEDEDQIILEVIGKLIGPFDELDQLMGRSAGLKGLNTLMDIFQSALLTPNPVKSLNDSIAQYRYLAGRKKLEEYLVISKSLNPVKAKLLLTQMIKDSIYFKNKISYNKGSR